MERIFFSSWAQADKHKDAYTQRCTRIRAGEDTNVHTKYIYKQQSGCYLWETIVIVSNHKNEARRNFICIALCISKQVYLPVKSKNFSFKRLKMLF